MKADRAQLKQLGAKMKIPQVNGTGRIYIPPGATIQLQFAFAEFAMGWAKVLVSKGFDAAVGALLAPIKSTARNSLKRLDDDVALTVATSMAKRWQAGKALYKQIGKEAVWKLAFDGLLKSPVLDGKLKAPYGVFSFSFSDKKGTFLWLGTFDDVPTPIDFKGIRGWTMGVIGGSYQPAIEDMTKDNPNYAAAPDEAN